MRPFAKLVWTLVIIPLWLSYPGSNRVTVLEHHYLGSLDYITALNVMMQCHDKIEKD